MGCTTLAWMILCSFGAAQDSNPDLSAPLRLPGLSTVKDKVGPTPEQLTKLEALYKEAGAKEDEIRKGGKDDPKKAANAIQGARTEFITKIKEVLNEEQDKKFDELTRLLKKKDKK